MGMQIVGFVDLFEVVWVYVLGLICDLLQYGDWILDVDFWLFYNLNFLFCVVVDVKGVCVGLQGCCWGMKFQVKVDVVLNGWCFLWIMGGLQIVLVMLGSDVEVNMVNYILLMLMCLDLICYVSLDGLKVLEQG